MRKNWATEWKIKKQDKTKHWWTNCNSHSFIFSTCCFLFVNPYLLNCTHSGLCCCLCFWAAWIMCWPLWFWRTQCKTLAAQWTCPSGLWPCSWSKTLWTRTPAWPTDFMCFCPFFVPHTAGCIGWCINLWIPWAMWLLVQACSQLLASWVLAPYLPALQSSWWFIGSHSAWSELCWQVKNCFRPEVAASLGWAHSYSRDWCPYQRSCSEFWFLPLTIIADTPFASALSRSWSYCFQLADCAPTERQIALRHSSKWSRPRPHQLLSELA